MNDEKNVSNLNGKMSEVPSVPIAIEMEEEAKTKKQQANEYPATKAPPLNPNALSVAPIPAAADCQPHFGQQPNIHALNEQRNFSAAADGKPQQKIYSIPLGTTTNAEVLNAGAAGDVGEVPPPTHQQQNVVYAAPTSSPMQAKQQFEVPPQQQQSIQIINMTTMVGGANANCVHKFETAANGCDSLCICLLVILLFPIGLIFLICIPFAMKKRCTKCGIEFQC